MEFMKSRMDSKMLTKLFTYLKHEQQLLQELVSLAEKQQKALVRINAAELEKIAAVQEEITQTMRNAEEYRLKLIMTTFDISRREAIKMNLSSIGSCLESEERKALFVLRDSIRLLVSRLQLLNKSNRALALRAKNYVREALGMLTNGTNQVCNVKV